MGNGRKPKNDVDESTIRSQLDRDELTKLRTSRLLDELEAENFDQNGSDFSLNSPNINLSLQGLQQFDPYEVDNMV